MISGDSVKERFVILGAFFCNMILFFRMKQINLPKVMKIIYRYYIFGIYGYYGVGIFFYIESVYVNLRYGNTLDQTYLILLELSENIIERYFF